MANPRGEPFHVALTALRDGLQAGRYAAGVRITATEMAETLNLSTTPVREALSRLAGEGLLEDRRGQGYFVRQLSGADIADLYRLSLAHLLITLDPQRPGWPSAEPRSAAADPGAATPMERVEALFRQWTVDSGSRAIVRAFHAVQVQLGPVRRLELQVFDDLEVEAERLVDADREEREARLGLLRLFHGRRIQVADRLAALAERANRAGKNSSDIV